MSIKQGFGVSPSAVSISNPTAMTVIHPGDMINLMGTVIPQSATVVWGFLFDTTAGTKTVLGSAQVNGGSWTFSNVPFPAASHHYTIKVVYEDTTGTHEHASQTFQVTTQASSPGQTKEEPEKAAV